MKLFILLSLMISFNVVAQEFSYFKDVSEEHCPGKWINFRNHAVYCKASDSKKVRNARVGSNLTQTEERNLTFPTYGAVDLSFVPDDSSDTVYMYTRWLLDSAGNKIGVLSIEGWINSEMDDSARFYVRYNLKGEMVMAQAKQI